MKYIPITLFTLFMLMKIEWLGINGAGLLTVAQLILIGAMDEWRSRREYEQLPYVVTRDENGVIQWTTKDCISKTSDFNTKVN